jgi:hypothetical protein
MKTKAHMNNLAWISGAQPHPHHVPLSPSEKYDVPPTQMY